MPWNFDSDRPIYLQLVEQIELMIFSGKYPPGSKLPSVRDMAKEAAVNPNTMQRALTKLEEDELIITHRTSGRYITEDENMINKARTRLAREQAMEFIANLQKLGFTKTEALSMITQMVEKEMKA